MPMVYAANAVYGFNLMLVSIGRIQPAHVSLLLMQERRLSDMPTQRGPMQNSRWVQVSSFPFIRESN